MCVCVCVSTSIKPLFSYIVFYVLTMYQSTTLLCYRSTHLNFSQTKSNNNCLSKIETSKFNSFHLSNPLFILIQIIGDCDRIWLEQLVDIYKIEWFRFGKSN